MDFDDILNSINSKFKTKLYLDEVSFFKIDNQLEIILLSRESVDSENITKFINNQLSDLGIQIVVDYIDLDIILGYFTKVFPNINFKLLENRFNIIIKNEAEIKFYESKDIFTRFRKKLNKLSIDIEFIVKINNDENYIKTIELEKEKELTEKIKLATQKHTKSIEKNKKSENIGMPDGQFTYGRYKSIPKDFTELELLHEDINKVKVQGKVFDIDVRTFEKGSFVSFDLENNAYAISCKLYVRSDKFEEFSANFKNGMGVILSGFYKYDEYEKCNLLAVDSIQEIKIEEKKDDAKEKRIELNIHTKYSNLESVVDVKALFNRLKSWGHEVVGITDLFNVQAYPEVYGLAKDKGIKLNLGLQTNILNSDVSILTNYYNIDIKEKDFVVFDIETTGLSNFVDKIIEFGAVRIKNGIIIDKFQEFVNPKQVLSEFTTQLTGIKNEDVVNADTIDLVMPRFLEFCKDSVLVAQNAEFDLGFVIEKSNMLNIEFKPVYMDTLYLARALHPDLKNHKLNTLTKFYQIRLLNHHRAIDDAIATGEIFIKMLEELKELNCDIDNNINKFNFNFDISKHVEYQSLFYVQNKVGLKNLYKIVSKSNLNYLNREPGIPMFELEKMREGLLIGTGNYKSKLFNLVSLAYSDDVLLEELNNFDFVCIVPIDFSTHLINRGYIRSKEHLMEINKKLIKLAKKQEKLYIAVGDVYYLDKNEYPFRNVLHNYPRKRSRETSGAFYLKTTNEMLLNYEYLGEELQHKTVIENPYKLNDLIEDISPIADGTFPPIIKNSDKILRQDSYDIAKSIYGENLPEIVEQRLDRELNSIISNGYSALYMIAKKLVKKSNDDGYLVGSRGSVGSSFAATMAEITEVNPLPPHYICNICKYADFDVDTELYTCGVDLPVKNCDKCSNELIREGFDIPFEVFLGFEGDKEPDIDLNFASVYQAKIHKYTETLFGKEKVFRAGTLGTIADKTAYGMAKKYLEFYPEDTTVKSDKANINRVKRAITGVKRTTGQHAGGLIIVPENKDIEDFTPIQYPADKKDSGIITTHFDYHAIDKNLLKLDLLGHNAPTIIRNLNDLSGINPVNINLSDQETMSIFRNTDSLNIKHEYTNIKDGSLGIPEFGTNFVRGMLVDTKPTTFEELIRISGLSHGTDVWIGNAQELIRQNICELKSAICTRDDIMNYLIEKGVNSKLSFDIMERVRKGKGLSEEQEKEMIENNVPEWYIDSCKKIKYMFPKAHAVAYVMMSFRIAYFKVHYPEYFYAVYFTNAIQVFKFEHISKGLDYLTMHIKSLKESPDFKFDDEFYVYELAEEMFARGLKFHPVDIYNSHPTDFRVLDNKTIIPPLMAISNVSESMALRIEEARKEGEFISVEDFTKRTKVNKTAIEAMENLGLFDGMQQTNQIDFFSF